MDQPTAAASSGIAPTVRQPSVRRRLDRAVKHVLLRRHVARRGFDERRLARWIPILRKLRAAIAGSDHPDPSITVEEVLSPRGPVAAAVQALGAEVRRQRLGWDELRPMVDLRKELCELYLRYARPRAHLIPCSSPPVPGPPREAAAAWLRRRPGVVSPPFLSLVRASGTVRSGV